MAMPLHKQAPLAGVGNGARPHVQPSNAVAAPSRLQEAPARQLRLGPTIEQAQILRNTNPFARFEPEPWATADLPIEEAATPPSSWYHSPDVWELEKEAIFGRQWTFVGNSAQLKKAGDYVTGDIAGNRYVIVRDEDDILRAFHNTCHHRAMAIAEGSGCAKMLECKYHGWRYDLKGAFRGATKMEGVKRFYANELALKPIRLESFGPLMFALFNNDMSKPSLREYFSTALPRMLQSGMEGEDLQHVHQASYDIACNWKVFNDNYLDSCYHCSFAHPGLTAALDLASYTNEIHPSGSFQLSPVADVASLLAASSQFPDIVTSRVEDPSTGPTYYYSFPNVMINRYAKWMDTLNVIPTGPDTCTVLIDYFVQKERVEDEEYVKGVVAGEHQVQVEDLTLCEGVQAGLKGPAFDVGRYSPHLEKPCWQFHQLVRKHLYAPANVPV